MDCLRRLGYHAISNREIYLLDLESPAELLPPLNLPSRYFSCLCVMDARSVSADDLGSLSVQLLRAGCVYFCAWGPDCGRVHDVMDEILVGDNPPWTSFEDIMTTWHEDSLAEALEFFLKWTIPYNGFQVECRSGLVIVVGSTSWSQEIADYISNEART